jgi:hypothetical protein
VVYASDGYTIYILTGKNTVKARNITKNNKVSVTIPYYKSFLHRLITVAPPAAISFKATAEPLEISDGEASLMYKKVLKFDLSEDLKADSLWIKLAPGNIATCYGVGISLHELRNPLKAHKIIKLSNT